MQAKRAQAKKCPVGVAFRSGGRDGRVAGVMKYGGGGALSADSCIRSPTCGHLAALINVIYRDPLGKSVVFSLFPLGEQMLKNPTTPESRVWVGGIEKIERNQWQGADIESM